MKKMKKWELLKKAYETFPAGTRFTWGGYTITSSGIFNFSDDERNKGHILDSNDKFVFDGKQWAEIIEEIKPEPKKGFVMMSEDWVSLEEGDVYFGVYKDHGKYILDQSDDEATKDKSINHYLKVKHLLGDYKVFSTKEAAEKWIEEQNKPRNITLFKDSEYPTIICRDYFRVMFATTKNNICGIHFTKEEFEQISEAFNKLQ